MYMYKQERIGFLKRKKAMHFFWVWGLDKNSLLSIECPKLTQESPKRRVSEKEKKEGREEQSSTLTDGFPSLPNIFSSKEEEILG